jgi:hypothetical protein
MKTPSRQAEGWRPIFHGHVSAIESYDVTRLKANLEIEAAALKQTR